MLDLLLVNRLVGGFVGRMVVFIGDAKLAIQPLHYMNVRKNQDYKDIDGTLLSPPKAEFESEEGYFVELIH